MLDALEPSPALIRTAVWDVVAWNRAATVMLIDYGLLPPGQRNIPRFIFLDPRVRAAQYDWESAVRFVVGAFSVDAAGAGGRRKWNLSLMNSAGSVPSSRRCGAITTSAPMVRSSSAYGIRCSARSPSITLLLIMKKLVLRQSFYNGQDEITLLPGDQ